MPAEIAPQTPRTGRPCAVCALPAPDRAAVEEALAQGISLSRISRSHGAPSRDSLRRHVLHGHLAPAIQEAVERLHALDSTSLAARLVDAARRAREVQIEAHEAGDHSTVLRAVDTEVRVIGALAAAGVEHESDPEQASAHRDVTRAAFMAVRANPELAHALAAELDRAYRPELAEQVRETALSGIEA